MDGVREGGGRGGEEREEGEEEYLMFCVQFWRDDLNINRIDGPLRKD